MRLTYQFTFHCPAEMSFHREAISIFSYRHTSQMPHRSVDIR